MADTPRILIQDALEQIKIQAPGVALNAADGARGLALLNQMLDEWSNEPYACFANLEQTFTLVPGKNSYTIGQTVSPVPDINAPRPLEIPVGQGTAYLVDTNNNRFPVNVIEQDAWNMIGLLTVTSQLPDTIFYDPQFPLGIINVFPTPSIAYVLHFDARLQLANLANLDTAFSLPPGYSSAIKNNLSVRLWPYYKQGTPDAWILELANSSLGKVKRTNIKTSPATYDSAIISRATSSYNPYTDSNNRRSG